MSICAVPGPCGWTSRSEKVAVTMEKVLERIAADLATAASALRSGDLDVVMDLLRRGVVGHGRIPGASRSSVSDVARR